MARAVEVLRAGRGVGERAEGGGTVRGGDACGGAVLEVDRHGEGGIHGLLIALVGDHEREVEAGEVIGGHTHTDEAARVTDEEGHLLLRDGLGGYDEVALVLSVFVVKHDQKLPGTHVGQRVLDRVEPWQWLGEVGSRLEASCTRLLLICSDSGSASLRLPGPL